MKKTQQTVSGSLHTKRNSIRRHYLVAAIWVAFALIVCTLSAQIYVATQSRSSTEDIHRQEKALNLIYQLQKRLRHGETIVSDHLITASKKSVQNWKKLQLEIDKLITQLEQSKWAATQKQKKTIEALKKDLGEINRHTLELLQIRLTIEKQFPALHFARKTMLPMNKKFTVAVNQALTELNNSNDQQQTGTAYQKFLRARWFWQEIINRFRMYTINRLFSLSEASLEIQTRDIEAFYSELKKTLDSLNKPELLEKLGLEAGIALARMRSSSARWYRDFLKVKAINSSKAWRTDRVIRNLKLRPLTNRVNLNIEMLANRIDITSVKNVTSLSRTADNIITTLWILSIAGLVLIVVAFKYFDITILRPVAQITEALHAEASGNHEYQVPNTDLSETRNLVHAFSYMRNQVQVRQSMLEHQALHDSLTRLPNRFALEVRLADFIARYPEGHSLALLILDLNRFKDINDSLGHHTGDRVLEQAGNRIQHLLRETDTIARWGGDEFAILLPDSSHEVAQAIAEKISRAISQVINVNENSLYIGASIGIAMYPEHAQNAEDLLKCADIAMYVSKRNNRDHYIYNNEIDDSDEGAVKIIDGLDKAIENDQLHLVLQPIVNLKNNEILGVEALLRWKHETHGLISPGDIITIAEHHGLIQPLMCWVISNALQLVARLDASSTDEKLPHIAVNISIMNLKDTRFVELVSELLEETGVSADRLMLEIPEESITTESRQVMDNIFKVSELGVKLSIDEYGTGHSSMAILKRLPVNTVKIDKSFVRNASDDETNAVIVRSTINLAHNLGLNVVAVGIENEDTRHLVELLESDGGQGYGVATPMSPDDFQHWLEADSNSSHH